MAWMIYDSIEPFGFKRDNLFAGLISSSIYNTTRTKQSDKVFSPSDFSMEYKPKKAIKKQSWQEAYEIAQTYVRATNKT